MHHDEAAVQRVNLLLEELCTYYKHVPTDVEADLWQMVVSEMGPEAVDRALRDHVGRSDFMPRIGGIRAYLGAVGTGSSSGAFEQVRYLVAQVGPYGVPNFEDPAIAHAIVSLGGWASLNESMPDPQADRFGYESLAKRFDVAYSAARAGLARGVLAGQIQLKSVHALNRDAVQERLALVHAREGRA